MALEEYALSPASDTGRVRGRPGPTRGTDSWPSNRISIGASPPCPAATAMTSGRPRPSTSRWVFVLSPPRDRPMP